MQISRVNPGNQRREPAGREGGGRERGREVIRAKPGNQLVNYIMDILASLPATHGVSL